MPQIDKSLNAQRRLDRALESLEQVDTFLAVRHLAAKDGDYSAALHELVTLETAVKGNVQ